VLKENTLEIKKKKTGKDLPVEPRKSKRSKANRGDSDKENDPGQDNAEFERRIEVLEARLADETKEKRMP